MSRHTPEIAWEFHTTNFTVTLELEPEDFDPRDSFEDAKTIEKINDGTYLWFQARVVVYGPDDEELGSDTLGGCCYESAADFYASHRDKDPMNRNCTLMRKTRGENVVRQSTPGFRRSRPVRASTTATVEKPS